MRDLLFDMLIANSKICQCHSAHSKSTVAQFSADGTLFRRWELDATEHLQPIVHADYLKSS
jgi:hypothetical protein